LSKPALSIFEFDRFRVDPNQRVLFKDGRPLSLPPKVFQTLLLLVEKQGQVVGKDEFFTRIWTDTIVEESNLTWNIHTIRKSLGETPKRRFIVTVPKVGFRFQETVRVVTPASVTAAAPAAAVPVTKAVAPDEIPSIGVLPFLNIGGDPANEYLSDGIAEEMIDVLARIKGLRVAARTSSFAFRGKDVDIRTIADVLGVTSLIEGSVRKSDKRIRVSVRLFDVNQGYTWTEVFESQTENMLDMQEDIARSVAENLRANLGVGLLPVVKRRVAVNPEAHNYQLLGRYFWNQRNEDSFRKAVQNFEAALRLEPRYALAHAGIADVFNALGMYRMMSSQEAFSKARQAARMALEIEPNLAEAHTAMGIVSNWLDWDWAAGEAHFLYALAAKPDYAIAHQWYALSLPIAGRVQDGIEVMCKALQLEPLSLGINATLCWMYFMARDSDRAIQQGLITLERDQQFNLAKYNLGFAYAQKGLFEESITTLKELRILARDASATISALAWVHGKAGEMKEATKCLADLVGRSSTQHVGAYDMAIAYTGLGDVKKAVEWLDRAVEDRGWLNHLPVHPFFDSLRDDAGFKKVLAKVRV
jgi:TolB-like protein/lipoprotein NlpI